MLRARLHVLLRHFLQLSQLRLHRAVHDEGCVPLILDHWRSFLDFSFQGISLGAQRLLSNALEAGAGPRDRVDAMLAVE